jgi:citronellol/citronellal dehydrogenase
VPEPGIFAGELLADQVAIVTGGGSGVGRQTALQLAACGARVVVCGRRAEPLEETVALDPEGRIESGQLDIREPEPVERFVDDVLGRHGRIDLLVNNAGGQFLAPAERITPKGFETVVRLNLLGNWNVTHAVATKAMIPAGPDGAPRGGKIISLTLTPHNGLTGMAHSSASRAGIENLVKVLGTEWARFGIRTVAIALGIFGTDTFFSKYPRQMVDAAAATVPLQSLGKPEDIAALIAFIASPHGDYLTGTTITIDGGYDNHVGRWPPVQMADEHGEPLIEARRPPSAS